jgi:arabinose-5-phosphate isomerase
VALSYSGETEEIVRLIPLLKRRGGAIVGFCCDKGSTLSRSSDVVFDISVEEEACAMGLAPTASTTAMLALGDALAVAVSSRKGFQKEDFAQLHPGGGLGRRLARVRDRMHEGEAVPSVAADTLMPAVIYEMSRKRLGMTTVTEGGRLAGVISDGDLRRLLEKDGPQALAISAGQAMNRNPRTITPDRFAAEALRLMEESKITSLVVVENTDRVVGVLHLHDLWGLNLI